MHEQNWLTQVLFSVFLASFFLFKPVYAHEEGDDLPTARQVGMASYYGGRFNGRRTASGERFDQNDLTAVHSYLPFGTIIRVTNLRNNRSVDLRINDRKHRRNHRLLDVSKRAAQELGFIGAGLARVEVEVIRYGDS